MTATSCNSRTWLSHVHSLTLPDFLFLLSAWHAVTSALLLDARWGSWSLSQEMLGVPSLPFILGFLYFTFLWAGTRVVERRRRQIGHCCDTPAYSVPFLVFSCITTDQNCREPRLSFWNWRAKIKLPHCYYNNVVGILISLSGTHRFATPLQTWACTFWHASGTLATPIFWCPLESTRL